MSNRIDFRHLASFVLACQNQTVSGTAREMGVSTSTLSVILHSLERNLELKLFERHGRFLRPLPTAFWLFQHATALLHAESFACSTVTRLCEPKKRIHLRLSLKFTLGRFSRALSRTVEAMLHAAPDTCFDFGFLNGDFHPLPDHGSQTAAPEAKAETEIIIGYSGQASDEKSIPLFDDSWVALSLNDAPEDLSGSQQPLVVVRMHQVLLDDVFAYAGRHGLSNRLSMVAEQPVDLLALPAHLPGSVILVPQSMLGDRLGWTPPRVNLLEPALSSRISARIVGPDHGHARLFIDRLKDELEAPAANAVFSPILTAQQIHYFNLTLQTGGISATARAAKVTQPTVSHKIQSLEAALGQKLFDRSPSGMEVSSAGRVLAPLSQEIEARLNAILSGRRSIAASTQSALAIGFLPSSGHDSAMTAVFSDALTTLRQGFPDCRLTIVEDTNAALHEAIRAGELNLAVVGSVVPSFARVKLGPSEQLSVVANPSFKLGGHTDIPLSEACALPLVLGAQFLSIHAAFADAAAELRLHINQVVEAGSLPLAISMVRRAPLCTVLPASSVRHDVAQGRLTSTPIAERLSTGNLAVIFSGQRELSELERAAVRALAGAFSASG